MLHKAIIFSLAVLSLANCNAQKKNKTKSGQISAQNSGVKSQAQPKDSNIIYFNEGENKFLEEYKMNVTFKNISEDSRCPADVNCVWAGVAVANVEVMGLATRPRTLQLSTLENAERNYHQSASFNGYAITLTEVTPYPTSTEGSKSLHGKYRIGITIKKGSPTDSTMK
ncbi:hypothetical protein [Chryseobacterium sp.]|uniref:hypothetical protein n=1 Tax=Chryseobacterium sp. TaxID=1871047 RepID=UPI0025BEDEF2|nr:hypothetical protein [Chryseobacterium sp.]